MTELTPRSSHVSVEVYDALGHRVRKLLGAERPTGRHTVSWDGRDGSGQQLPSGIYLYRVKAGELEETGRLVLMSPQ